MENIVLIRGGGDLASGVALRLYRVGMRIAITEIAQPLAVRRLVSFAEAVYQGEFKVEDVTSSSVDSIEELYTAIDARKIPVIVDPELECLPEINPLVLIDARMTKKPPELSKNSIPLVIGLGPGFIGGENCHAAIETNRGHFLGRVIWDGSPESNTGIPEAVVTHGADRVLRSPANGVINNHKQIGSSVMQGEVIASVNRKEISAPFDGILRGLLHEGLQVHESMKIGDLDPRNNPVYATSVSEKALAIGGGVLEAILSKPEIRKKLWR